jgi:acyl dehydratase
MNSHTPASPALATGLASLRARVGSEIGRTDWENFDQAQVSAYGAMTGENLWIHTDPVRAAGSRFGSTIVQASLLMARFGSWIQACGAWLPEPAVPVNYGYDRVRILGALPVGERVRARVVLQKLTETAGAVRMQILLEVQRPNQDRPVISAQWIVMFLLPD